MNRLTAANLTILSGLLIFSGWLFVSQSTLFTDLIVSWIAISVLTTGVWMRTVVIASRYGNAESAKFKGDKISKSKDQLASI